MDITNPKKHISFVTSLQYSIVYTFHSGDNDAATDSVGETGNLVLFAVADSAEISPAQSYPCAKTYKSVGYQSDY